MPSSSTRTDGDLARAIAAGAGASRREEEELCMRFARRVYLFGLRHLRDRELASDLSQDVLARVIERLRAGEVRDPEQLTSFVLGTARVMAHDERRRARRRGDLAARVLVENEGEHVTLRETRIDLQHLQGCLERLGERERTIVMLTFCAQQSPQEIAASVALSLGNIRVLRHRAVASLRECMGIAEERA